MLAKLHVTPWTLGWIGLVPILQRLEVLKMTSGLARVEEAQLNKFRELEAGLKFLIGECRDEATATAHIPALVAMFGAADDAAMAGLSLDELLFPLACEGEA